MQISIINSDRSFNKNELFSHDDQFNLLYPFFKLKNVLHKKNIDINTSDISPPESSDIVFFNEAPKERVDVSKIKSQNSYLILLECEIIRKNNYNENFHKYFKKVLTWDDDLITKNPDLYIKSNFTQSLKKITSTKKTKLLCCISANKKVDHPNELYSRRLNIIRWLEKNDPSNFDLYGYGWGHYKFSSNGFLRPLNFFTKFLPNARFRRSWKGSVQNKIEILSNYKFNICLENAYGYNGYITEKIFDSFRAGTIPIYLGCPNISKHIPDNCYIDLRRYRDFSDCYDYIKSMNEEEYDNYQTNISNFLDSKKAYFFSDDCFIETVLNLINDEKNDWK